jgi:hypothetical protein
MGSKVLAANRRSKMNAYELYAAAFDSAQSEYSENTVEYITGYADGAFNINLKREVAEKIIECRLACGEKNEENGEWGFNHDNFIRRPLLDIEVD